MRKITSFILVFVLVAAVALALVSCVPVIEVPDDENPYKVPVATNGELPEAIEMLTKISDSFSAGDGVTTINLALPTRLNGKTYSVNLRGNIPAKDDESIELLFNVTDGGKVLFGLYVVEGRIYIEVFDEYKNNSVKVYVEDIDFNYLYNLVKKLDFNKLLGLLDGVIGGLLEGMTISSLVTDMLVPLLFTTTGYKVSGDSSVEEIDLKLDVNQLLGMVGPLLADLNLDTLIPGVSVVNLSGFVSDLIASIPEFNVTVHSVIENGKNKVFDVALNTPDEVFGFSADVKFGSGKIETGIPEDILSYEPFSITNIAFNIDFGIRTEGLDIGKLVNIIVPNTLPENLFVFTSDRALTLKVNIDLDPQDNNKNLILLELYNGNDTENSQARLFGAYFIDGVLRINVDQISSAVKIPNIEIYGLDISSLIMNLVDMLKGTIEGAIDSLMGDSEAEQPDEEVANAADIDGNSSLIVPVSVNANGTPLISADVTAFFSSLLSVFRMEKYVKLEGDAFTIKVDENFFTDLGMLVPSIQETIEPYKKLGTLEFAINFAPYGIDNIDLNYSPTNDDKNILNINMNSFLFGFSTPGLEKTIRSRTANKEYANNLESLLSGALDGVSLAGNLNIGIKKGEYNLADLFGELLSLPSVKFEVPEDVVLDASLNLQLSYDMNQPENTKGILEITLNKGISIFKPGKLIGVYIKGNDIYLEINGIGDIQLPKIKIANSGLIDMIHAEITKLPLDMTFTDLITGLFNGGTETASAVSDIDAFAAESGSAMDGILNILDIELNATTLKLAATSIAIQNLLAKFGISLTLPEFNVKAEITDLNDMKLQAGMSFIELNLAITDCNIGQKIDIELPIIDENEYVGDLKSIINNMLRGVDVEAALNITFNEGFDLVRLLKQFGVALPFELDLKFDKETVVGFNVKLQMAYDAENKNNNQFLLQLDISESVLFLPKGRFITIYGDSNSLYIDVAAINGVKLPKIKLDIDIMSMLSELIDGIDMNLGDLINPASVSTDEGIFAAVNETRSSVPEIILKQNYIKLYITNTVIMELLKQFGVVTDFELPEFDLDFVIDGGSVDVPEFNGIFVKVNATDYLSADLSVTSLVIGQPVIIEKPQLNDDYIDSLSNIAAEILKGIDLRADMNIDLAAGTHNLTGIMQMFGIAIPDSFITLYNNVSLRASLLLQASYDRNNPANSKIKLELYVKDDLLKFIKGSESVPFLGVYGKGNTLYAEINNLVDINIPKAKVEFDIFGLLMDELEKIDIQELIYGAINGGNSDGTATVANDDISVIINNESLKLKATMAAIANLIGVIAPGTSIDIPNFDISLEISTLDNIKISASNFLNMLSLDLSFSVNTIGKPVDIDLDFLNDEEYTGNLNDLIINLFDGVDIRANLKMQLYKGMYDLSKYIDPFVSGLPSITLDIREDTVLDLTLKIQLKYMHDDLNNSKALIQIYNNKSVAFAKEGVLLSVYSQYGQTYVEIGNLLGVNVPKLRIDFDIMSALHDVLTQLDLNELIRNNLPSQYGGQTEPVSVNVENGIATVADFNITIDNDTLKLVVTANALRELLKSFGVEIDLPAIDITASIANLGDINITANVDTLLTLSLSTQSLKLGDSSVKVEIPDNINDDEYLNNIKDIVNKVLSGVSITADAKLKFLPGEHDLSDFISLFGVACPPILFTVPAEAGVEYVYLDVTLTLEMRYDSANPKNSVFKLELNVNNDFLIFKGGKKLIGVYYTNGKTYLEVSPDGAIDGINNLKIMTSFDVMGELKKIIDSIDFDLSFGGGEEQPQPISKVAYSDPLGDINSGSVGVIVNQNSVAIAITSQAVVALLEMFGISIKLPSIDASIEIKETTISLDADIAGMFGATLTLRDINIGSEVNIEMPDFDDDSYASDLGALVDSLLEGVHLSANIDFTITKDFDLDALLKAFGQTIDLSGLKVNIGNEGVKASGKLDIMFKYDAENPDNSKGLIELYLTEAPIFFDNAALEAGAKPFLGVYVEGKNIYIEINHIKGVNIPKIKIEYDFMSQLKKLIDDMNISFDTIFNPNDPSGGGVSTVAAGYSSDENINIGVKQDSLAVAVTMTAIKQLLEAFGVDLNLPEFDLSIDADISTLSNISLKLVAGVESKDMLVFNLQITSFKFGDKSIQIDLEDKIIRADGAYNQDLQSLLFDILKGVDIAADFKLKINRGFDIASFLNDLGVVVTNLDVKFTEDVVIDATLKIQLTHDSTNTDNTRGKIELIVNQSALFINKGLLLGIYIYGNEVYIKVGGYAEGSVDKGGIAGFEIPGIKLHTDFVSLLDEQIKSLDIDFVLDKALNNDDSGIVTTAAKDESSGINITINQESLKLFATSMALQTLLDNMGVTLGFTLPKFEITGEINGLDDIFVQLNQNEFWIAEIHLTTLNLGKKDMTVDGMPDFGDVSFSDDISAILGEVLKGIDLEANVKLQLNKGKYDVTELLSSFGAVIDTPIEIDIAEDVLLDAKLILQVNFNINDPKNSKLKFEIWINQDIALFKTGKLLGVYVDGDKIYVELDNIENVKIPKIKLQVDVMTMLADLIKNIELDLNIKIGEMIGGGGAAATVADESAGGLAGGDVAIEVNQNAIVIAATSTALSMLLSNFGLGMSLPEFDFTAEIKNLDGVTLNISVNANIMKLLTADLDFTKIIIGRDPGIEFDINEADYTFDAATLVSRLLEGIDIEGNANVNLPAGKYDFGAFLKSFGLSIPPIAVNFTNDIVLNSRFIFQTAYRPATNTEGSVSKAKIEWVITNPYDLVAGGVQLVDDRAINNGEAVILGLYVDGDAVYLDLSNLIIANIRLPKVKLNMDVFGTLIELIDSLGADFIFDIATASGNGSDGRIAAVNDNNNNISIGVSSDAITFKVTALAITTLLAQLGINIELPEMSLNGEISELNGINIWFNMGFTGQTISMDLVNIKAKFGNDAANPIDIAIPDGLKEDKNFGATVNDIILNLISDVNISGKLDIDSRKGNIDITGIINAIMATSLERIDLPISLNMDNFSNAVYFNMQWHLDKKSPRNSTAAITLHTEEGNLKVSIFLQSGTLYVDLTSFGLMKFKVSNFNLTEFITLILEKISPELTKDLGEMLGGLISGGISPVSDGGSAMTPEQAAREQKMNAAMAQAIAEAGEEDEPVDLLTMILKCLNITDTLIKLDFSKDVLSEVLRQAGAYIGFDLYGTLAFDFIKGTLVGDATIADFNLSLDFAINSFGDPNAMEGKVKFQNFMLPIGEDGFYPLEDNVPNQDTYVEYSLISGADLLMSILTARQPGVTANKESLIYIDTYFYTQASKNLGDDTMAGGYGSGGVARFTVERFITAREGFNAGTLKVTYYKEYGNQYNPVNIFIDVEGGYIKVGLTEYLFNFMGYKADKIAIPNIALDLKSTVGGLLDPIFADIFPDRIFIKDNFVDNGANIVPEDVPTPVADSKGSETGDTTDSALGITDYLKGIEVSFYETGTTNIHVDVNGEPIDEMLFEMLCDLFMTLDLGSGPANIDYRNNQKSELGLYNEVLNKLVVPLAKSAGISLSGGIINTFLGPQIKDVILRLLPIPRFTDMDVDITLAESVLQKVTVGGWDTGRSSDELRLNLYLANQENVTSWGDIPGKIVHDPYANNSNKNPITSQLDGKRASRNIYNNGAHRDSSTSAISYTGDYDRIKEMENSGNYTAGIYNVRATATNSRYNGDYVDIPVEILETKTIASVTPMMVFSYDDIPNTVELVFTDGTSRIVTGVEVKLNEGEIIPLEGGNAMGTVTLGNGETHEVKLMYTNSAVSKYDNTIYTTAYDKNSLQSALPSRIFFQYKSNYFDSQEVIWHNDDLVMLSNLSDEQWRTGYTTTVRAIIPAKNGTPEQIVPYNLVIKPIEISSVQFGEETFTNTLTVDAYEAYGQNEADANGVLRNPSFPNAATITYTDGRSQTIPIIWDADTLRNIVYTQNAQSLKIEITNEFGDVKWGEIGTSKPIIDVKIASRKIKYVSFGTDSDGNDIKELDVNPYEYMNDNTILPDKVKVVFTEDDSLEMNCAWQIPDGAINQNGGFVQVGLSIMDGTPLQSDYKPLLNVKRMIIKDINLPKNPDNPTVGQLVFDDAAMVLYGGTDINKIMPSRLEFILEDGEITEIPVKGDFSRINISKEGNTFTNTVFTLPDGTQKLIDIIVNPLVATATVTDTLYIEKEALLESGEDAFPTELGIIIGGKAFELPVTWNLDNVTADGGVAYAILAEGSVNEQRVKVIIEVVESPAASQQL